MHPDPPGHTPCNPCNREAAAEVAQRAGSARTMLLMPALVAARNWYWAENKRCDELIVGTWAMGHSM